MGMRDFVRLLHLRLALVLRSLCSRLPSLGQDGWRSRFPSQNHRRGETTLPLDGLHFRRDCVAAVSGGTSVCASELEALSRWN